MRLTRAGVGEIDALCGLPPAEAAEALRELLEHPAAVRCARCQARYEARGDLEALPRARCPQCGGDLEPCP